MTANLSSDEAPRESMKVVELTAAARAKVLTLMEKEKGSKNFGLRVSVAGGGCSGFSYKMSFEAAPSELDRVTNEDGLQVLVDPKSALFLQGLRIDYVDGLNGSGFVYENPKAKKSCGCGTSFSV